MKVIDLFGTGRQIKNLLTERNMTQSDLARKLGLTPMAVHKWIVGKSVPTVDNLVCLSEIFDLEIDHIIVTTII